MAEKQETGHMEEEEEETPDQYKVAKKVSVNEILNMDKNDDSLQKYKQSLGISQDVFAPKDDPRRVVIEEMKVSCENRPAGDIVYKLETPEAIAKLTNSPFVLKEGSNYRFQLVFRVQHELCLGLKYVNTVTRLGVKVATNNLVIGSFAPQKQSYVMTFPKHGWEETPKGMLARGSYKARTQFIDDDNQKHLEFEYAFEIKKEWE